MRKPVIEDVSEESPVLWMEPDNTGGRPIRSKVGVQIPVADNGFVQENRSDGRAKEK